MLRKIKKIISLCLVLLFIFQQSGFAQIAGQLDISGHLAGLRNAFSPDVFRPLHLRYLSYNPLENNFQLFLDKGSLKNPNPQELESTTKILLNYFFVGVTLPNDTFWVNLRPDAEDNIIDDRLAQTDVGKIMLESDLQLKKDTARFTSPETPEGKEYWDKLYKKAGEIFGYDNVTIPTLTRPWIVPDEIIIRESAESAYVYKATLKVMLEQDYLTDSAVYNFEDVRLKELNEYSSQLIRQLIIPKLTKEVNSSKRYASLRQVYYSLIMAQWFKARYANKDTNYSRLINRKDLTNLISKEPWSKTTYFKQYQRSFKDGEYNISEPVYTPYGQTIRSYFSGGISGFMTQPQVVQELSRPIGDADNKAILPAATPVAASPDLNGYLIPGVYNAAGQVEITHEDGIRKGASSPTNFLPDASWETAMTNPSRYNKGEFRYIVHAVKLPEERIQQKIFISEQMKNGERIPFNHIELLENPAKIGDKPIISTSLIDETHRGTWTSGGFILRVPADNILKAASQDIGTLFFGGGETVKKLYAERDASGIVSSDEVLKMTSPYIYNEVVVTGTGRSGKRVEIIGVFIKVSSNGQLKDPRLVEQLRALAYRNRWPIIEITERFIPYRDSNPDEYIEGSTFAFNHGGKRYLFDTEGRRFTILEEGGTISRLMTPAERAEAVRIIEEFLQGSPNPTLKILVERVKSVPDREIEERAEEMKAFKEGRVYYRDKPPEALGDDAIAIQQDHKRYVVNKDGVGWVYAPSTSGVSVSLRIVGISSIGADIDSRRMSGEEIVDFMRQVGLWISTNPADREQLEKVYKIISEKLNQSPPGGSATSSPAVSSLDNKNAGMGGIDFRSLPIVTHAINNLGLNTSHVPLNRFDTINLEQEWQEIQKMTQASITPSTERIKEYIQLSCLKGELNDKQRIVSCIADILRAEEERCFSTEPILKDILVVLESGRSSQELKAIFTGNQP